MKNLLISAIIILNPILSYGIEINNELLDAIAKIESNSNPRAVGDNGKSIGCLQIQKCCVNDVNRIQKKWIRLGIQKTPYIKYTLNDCYSKSKSYKIAKIYLKYYGELYEKKTSNKATFEVLSKIWNAGPNGYNKSCSLVYWNKVNKWIKLMS